MMLRKYVSAVFLLGLLLGGLTVAAAQEEREITAQEFKDLEIRGYQKLKGRTYRMTMLNETFTDRDLSPEIINTMMSETVQPDRRRFVSEIKSPTINSKVETVWLDGKGYKRKNDGPWEETSPGSGVGSASGTPIIRKLTRETYRFVGKSALNNQTAGLYESIRHHSNSSTGQETISTTKFWISEDGLLLKTLSEFETVGNKSLMRMQIVYDYDPNIKIEAPVLSGKLDEK